MLIRTKEKTYYVKDPSNYMFSIKAPYNPDRYVVEYGDQNVSFEVYRGNGLEDCAVMLDKIFHAINESEDKLVIDIAMMQ